MHARTCTSAFENSTLRDVKIKLDGSSRDIRDYTPKSVSFYPIQQIVYYMMDSISNVISILLVQFFHFFQWFII